jgi:hypothetical protein
LNLPEVTCPQWTFLRCAALVINTLVRGPPTAPTRPVGRENPVVSHRAGVVAPKSSGILPRLSPLAATDLAMLMVCGFATHVPLVGYLRSGSYIALFALAAFAAHGLLPRL